MEASKEIVTSQMKLLSITWPIFIELFLQVIMGSSDTVMLAHISDDAVAAVGVANQLVFLNILIFNFVSTGTAVTVSQFLGAKLNAEAKNVAALSITLNLVIGLLLSLTMLIFRSQFLGFFHLTNHIAGMGKEYLSIVGGTLFIQAVLLTVSSILRANGFTRDAMLCSLFMNVVHLIGNSIFIFGLFGVPVMGIRGVGISTFISRSLALSLIFWIMYKRLPIKIKLKDYVDLNPAYIKKILQIGIPAASEQICYNLSQMAITAIIAMLGAAALTTRIYTANINSYVLLFGLAMGQGTQILVGYKVGAGDFNDAYRQLLKSLKYSLIITIFVAIVISILRHGLIGIFTNDKEIVNMGSKLLLFSLILEPGRTFNLVVISSLRATGDATISVKMALLSMWGISVPLAYFLGIHLGMGLTGVYVAFTVDEWFRGITMYFRWRSRVWEKKVLVHKQTATTV